MMTDYTKMLKKYGKYMEKVEKYDPDEMSAADASYYLEVTTRVSKKLLEMN